MTNQQAARKALLAAIQQAEQNLIDLTKSGKAGKLDDPFHALTALVIHAGFVVDGGTTKMSINEMLQMQTFITTCEEYQPSKEFPFTKEQMRIALENAM